MVIRILGSLMILLLPALAAPQDIPNDPLPPTIDDLKQSIDELSGDVDLLSNRVSNLEVELEQIPRPDSDHIIWLDHISAHASGSLTDRHRTQIRTGGGSRLVFGGPGSLSFCGFRCEGRVKYVAAPLPPGYKITGVRVCYSVSDSRFNVFRTLLLHQYRPTSTSGGLVAGWNADIPLLPFPPIPGGDDRLRACLDTNFHATKHSAYSLDTCIDPSVGKLELDMSFRLLGSRQNMYIEAVGLTYDTTC